MVAEDEVEYVYLHQLIDLHFLETGDVDQVVVITDVVMLLDMVMVDDDEAIFLDAHLQIGEVNEVDELWQLDTLLLVTIT